MLQIRKRNMHSMYWFIVISGDMSNYQWKSTIVKHISFIPSLLNTHPLVARTKII